MLALIIAILAGVWAYGEGYFDTVAAPPTAPVAEASLARSPPVAEAPPAGQQDGVYVPPAEPSPPTDTGDAGGGGVVAPEAAAESADGAAAASAPLGTPVSGGPVVITSNDEVWFKVYDKATRQSVKMGILKPGERYVVPADRDDLLLWTGKAGALEITVAGRKLPALGGPQTMVKDVSLNPASLLARAGG